MRNSAIVNDIYQKISRNRNQRIVQTQMEGTEAGNEYTKIDDDIHIREAS